MPGDRSQRKADPALLCVAHFPTNTGYAWDFIESLYAGVARRLEPHDVTTWVSYPVVDAPPKTLQGSPAREVELRVNFDDRRSVRRLIRFIRSRNVRALYMADQPAWHPVYPLLRRAGVRWIVVHDHTSGERTPLDRDRRADQAALPAHPGDAGRPCDRGERLRGEKEDRGRPGATGPADPDLERGHRSRRSVRGHGRILSTATGCHPSGP